MAKRKLESDCELPKPKRRRLLDRAVQDWMYSLRDREKRADFVKCDDTQIIDEDGLDVPNKNKKPNGADKFNEEQQGPYEIREKQSKHDVEAVNEHNSNYPKMKNVLDKRKSIFKPTALCLKRSSEIKALFDHKNSRTKLLKRLDRYKSVNKRRKNKPKKNRRRKVQRKRHNSRDCHVCAFLDEVGRMYDIYTLATELQMASEDNQLSDLSDKSNIDHLHGKNKSEGQKPDGCPQPAVENSNPSITTYNSFESLDHEPTVSR